MQDIAMFRALAANPGVKTIAIGTTWGSSVSVGELVAHLESVALAAKSNPAVAPGSVRLSTDYYDSFNVGGGSSIQIIPDGSHFKIKYWGYTECTYYGSTATAAVKGDLRATNSGGTWFLYNDASLSSGMQTTSGSYELTALGDGNSYYMTGKHYCLPGFGEDRYFKTTNAYASH